MSIKISKQQLAESIKNELDAFLNEAKDERTVKTSTDLFDALSTLKTNVWMSIGYLSAVSLSPDFQYKAKNPLTNRTKSYPDYARFGKDYDERFSNGVGKIGNREIAGIVKLTKYSRIRFIAPEVLSKKYKEFRDGKDRINQEYGLSPVNRDSNKGKFKSTQEFGKNNVQVYGGANDEIKGHSYLSVNTFGATIKPYYYIIDTNGKIIREISDKEAEYYIKKAPDVEDKLRDLNKSDEEIKKYIDAIKSLKFNYQVFENSGLLYIVAKSEEFDKIVFINENLKDYIGSQAKENGVAIDPQEFIKIAASQYRVELENLIH